MFFFFIDPFRIAENNAIIFIKLTEGSDALRQTVGKQDIVGGEVNNKISATRFKGRIKCFTNTLIFRERNEYNVWILFNVSGNYGLTIVATSVVDDNQLEIWIGLAHYRLQTSDDVMRVIKARANDRDFW